MNTLSTIDALYPKPKHVETYTSTFDLQTGTIISFADFAHQSEARWLQAQLEAVGIACEVARDWPGTAVRLAPHNDLEREAYRLTISDEGIEVIGGSGAGIFYGLCTLVQLVRVAGTTLPHVMIEDAPNLPIRGFMLDISRDRVPTMTTLFRLIDLLASLKYNQLQLYTEHTFAYAGHREVWQHASPITPDEWLHLTAYCRQRHIDLVPNQNSLGHMERWLKYEKYAHMAESPDGFVASDGDHRGPSTLDPQDPASLALVTDLYDQLLSQTEAQTGLFNVGCDEPWELGQGKNQQAVAERGGHVYLDWILRLHQILAERGRQMLLWGDIIIKYPDLVPELPQNITVLEWGYEANHPFAESCQQYVDAGVPFYVCPGTSSWNSLAGRATNTLGNIDRAVAVGRELGAAGMLLTDWGDRGHWQPLLASYLGIVYGAGAAWNADANTAEDAQRALNRYVYGDESDTFAQLTVKLADTCLRIGPPHVNGSLLAYALQWGVDELDARLHWITEVGGTPPDISPATLRDVIAEIDETVQRISTAQIDCDDAELVRQEWTQTARLLAHGGRYLLWSQGESDISPKVLLEELETLITEQHKLWLQRSRPGGLADSLSRFDPIRQSYRTALG